MADPLAESVGQVPPELLQLLQPLMDVVGPIISTLSWMLGGIFGIYMLWLIIKIYYDHKRIKILKEIRNDIKFLREQAESKIESKNNNKKSKKKAKKKK
jgi:hypothetical protein